jgi:hypothetical protein
MENYAQFMDASTVFMGIRGGVKTDRNGLKTFFIFIFLVFNQMKTNRKDKNKNGRNVTG